MSHFFAFRVKKWIKTYKVKDRSIKKELNKNDDKKPLLIFLKILFHALEEKYGKQNI